MNHLNQRKEQQKKGQFWTPQWLAQVMYSYLKGCSSLVLDPAIGNGAFVKAAISMGDNPVFYGCETDTTALLDPIFERNQSKLFNIDFFKAPIGSQDSIIANPPYIRHHKISIDKKTELSNMAYDITGCRIDKRAGLHVYFFIKCLSLLKKNGKLVFLLPSDVCEGKYAKDLWRWIFSCFAVECVMFFGGEAVPFPNVDTNVFAVFIQNRDPLEFTKWIRINDTQGAVKFVESGFEGNVVSSTQLIRSTKEALETGLSREPFNTKSKKVLGDFANVMRGVVTGANDFFFMNKEKMKQTGIDERFFIRAIGKTKDVTSNTINDQDLIKLEQQGRPTFLLNINEKDADQQMVSRYIEYGESIGINKLPLCASKKYWYKTEYRKNPPIIFSYLGRNVNRFIKNDANIVPLTCFLCVYPKQADSEYINRFHTAMNQLEVTDGLKMVGKSYGGGAIKVEPKQLLNLPIPDHIVEKFNL